MRPPDGTLAHTLHPGASQGQLSSSRAGSLPGFFRSCSGDWNARRALSVEAGDAR
ncbi:MAG: hypothetical protein JOZ69_15010 [Myxococcales bacterium]|nr:hypothetical protein [Myxococcales bacterium]